MQFFINNPYISSASQPYGTGGHIGQCSYRIFPPLQEALLVSANLGNLFRNINNSIHN